MTSEHPAGGNRPYSTIPFLSGRQERSLVDLEIEGIYKTIVDQQPATAVRYSVLCGRSVDPHLTFRVILTSESIGFVCP